MAVYRSGYITACDRCDYRPKRPWQNWAGCGDTAFSFELKIGASYVVQQIKSGCAVPPQCQTPAEPDGNIVCKVDFTVAAGDKLVPTWWEASNDLCTGGCRVSACAQLSSFDSAILAGARTHQCSLRMSVIIGPIRSACLSIVFSR